MSGESVASRLFRSYARWRTAGFFALAVLFAAGYGALGGGLLEAGERGGWLAHLFSVRGAAATEWPVEIVGFDKTADAPAYADLLKTNPTLRQIVEARGVTYDRAVFAALLDRLVDSGARLVVFDFVFEGKGPSESGDAVFAAAIAKHRDKVVIGFDYTFTERSREVGATHVPKTVATREPDETLLPEENPDSVLGFVTVWPDADGAIRQMVAREDAVTLSREELAGKGYAFRDMSLTARAASKLGVAIPQDNATRLIRFEGPARTFRMTPVQDLFTPDQWTHALGSGARFKDKVVVVGPYSEIHYKDSFATPVGRMLGVEIQANCLHNYMTGRWIRRPLSPESGQVILAAALVAFVWAANTLVRTRRVFLRLACIFGALTPLPLLGAHVAFGRYDVFLPMYPALVAAMLAVTYVMLDFAQAQYDRARIKGMFGTYLSPAIVNRMVASGEEPRLGGEQVRLTAFFSDVQGFSSFSEILTPEQLVEIMNAYLGAMTDILERDEGTLDKYIGDAIVAMFGAPIAVPDHAHRACACALRMQKRLAALRAEWAAQGDRWPGKIHAMRMRIGLNTGPATVGNMGSAKRFNYTMMGDTVNLAARCESGAKSAGVYILISGETMAEASRSTGEPILFRRCDRWRVKGRSAPVLMVEVVDFLAEASAETRECVRLYEAALDLYFERRFAEAKAIFERARVLEPLQPGRDAGVEHSPSEIMSSRCDAMLENPPGPDWDGVFTMQSK